MAFLLRSTLLNALNSDPARRAMARAISMESHGLADLLAAGHGRHTAGGHASAINVFCASHMNRLVSLSRSKEHFAQVVENPEMVLNYYWDIRFSLPPTLTSRGICDPADTSFCMLTMLTSAC